MADTVSKSDRADFLTNAAWAVHSTYHAVLKTSPGAAIFERDMLFDVPYLAVWTKIGDYRQKQTDNTQNGRTLPLLTGIINCKKMVSSARLKADMKVILGPPWQFKQMAP